MISLRLLALAALAGTHCPLLHAWTVNGSGPAFAGVDEVQLVEAVSQNPVATIPVNEAAFTYEGPTEAGHYLLRWGQERLELAMQGNQEVMISGADAASLQVAGSADTHLLQAYHAFRQASLARLVLPVRAAARQARDAGNTAEAARLAEQEVQHYAAHRRELVDFTLAALPDSPALATAAQRWGGDYRLPEIAAAVAALQQAYPEATFTRALADKVAALERIAIGAEAPPVEGLSPTGEPVRLADFRGKWVLLDFWASWCPPCRSENAHYRTLYATYAPAGLEIVAVSLDKDARGWKRAIQQDEATWTHLSRLQGMDDPNAIAYSVTALPASFLINPQGQIVATDLRGDALAKRMGEIFGTGEH